METAKSYRLCDYLSRRQRQETPLPFARELLGLARALGRCREISILWTMKRSNYEQIAQEEKLDLWGVDRDANSYSGPNPIIAHPPCGPWGKFRLKTVQNQDDGIRAIYFAHLYSGIVEQPVGSLLFKQFGRGGKIIQVNQGDYGHLALKPTLLYCVAKVTVADPENLFHRIWRAEQEK